MKNLSIENICQYRFAAAAAAIVAVLPKWEVSQMHQDRLTQTYKVQINLDSIDITELLAVRC